ncbi:SusC/RagA family TonB-linked outer membrane protein [Pedobacter sandarakinus]|uniref:SusC/RagA family TonB-linked outer membrane protein n=1 Tax=Pedobacter sandarakinus TaxID=353156 RepID=UPI00224799B5|nr:TonB-dependent receptor [Pedobacter sandarakinus]MCX2575882.1 TonB-dependent receptor [Pedobacter sandarakinus]
MLKLTAVFWLLCACILPAYAIKNNSRFKKNTAFFQEKEGNIRGTVTDEQGVSIPAVTIVIKNKTIRTVTDGNGRYSIAANENDVLVFNYVGFKQQEIRVGSSTTINVKLITSSESLTEVVVVGYGEQRRTSVTGSIATVNSAELTETPVPTVSQALIGKVAGVTSRAPDGRPGAEARLQIRNLGDPLYVIDGVPSGAQQFNNLNSEDIESLSILKDAAAAIYGLRASNGVVLVLTKKGGLNKENRINVNAYYGLQSLFRFPKAANAGDYVRALAEADINQNGTSVWTPEEVNKWQQGVPGYEGFDWSTYIKDYAPQSYINLNTTGGSQKTSYYLSLSRTDQDAVFEGYNFNRTNLQTNLETRIGQRLKAGVKINGKIEIRDLLGLPGDDDYFNALLGQFRNLPTESPYANGNPNYPATNNNFATNYATFEYSGYNKTERRTLQTTFDLEYKFPIKGLTANGMYSFFYNNLLGNTYEKTYKTYTYNAASDTYNVTGGQQNPYRSRDNGYIIDNVLRLQLNYAGTFGKHNVSAIGAMETQERVDKLFFVRSQPVSNEIDIINFFNELQAVSDRVTEEARAGFIFRANYDYDSKYLLEIGGRYDGSWRFPKGHRWGLFPFISAGWRISKADFMQGDGIKKVITDLKLRASYGETGSEDNGVGAFAYLPGYNFGSGNAYLDGQLITGIAARGLPVTRLTWVKSAITNIAVDFNLWSGKLGGSVEVFRRDLTGIPAPRYDVLLPIEVGFTAPSENLNANRTLGVEMALNHAGKTGGLEYSVGVNATLARLRNVYTYKPRFGNSIDRYRNSIEDRWARINWGYEFIGQFQTAEEIANYPVDIDGQNNTTLLPGDFIYKDQNNDGVIDGLDERPNGYSESNLPYLNFGLNSSFAYKGFDVQLNFAGATMQSRGRAAELKLPFQNDANSPDFLLNDRWHRENIFDPNSAWIPGTYPALKKSNNESNQRASSFWFRNTSYLRLRNVQLGYNLPQKWLKGASITKVRIYANGFNLFSIDNLKDIGIDPETQLNTGLEYPSVRVYNLGVNLTF